jgi:hypothetical protein
VSRDGTLSSCLLFYWIPIFLFSFISLSSCPIFLFPFLTILTLSSPSPSLSISLTPYLPLCLLANSYLSVSLRASYITFSVLPELSSHVHPPAGEPRNTYFPFRDGPRNTSFQYFILANFRQVSCLLKNVQSNRTLANVLLSSFGFSIKFVIEHHLWKNHYSVSTLGWDQCRVRWLKISSFVI